MILGGEASGEVFEMRRGIVATSYTSFRGREDFAPFSFSLFLGDRSVCGQALFFVHNALEKPFMAVW